LAAAIEEEGNEEKGLNALVKEKGRGVSRKKPKRG